MMPAQQHPFIDEERAVDMDPRIVRQRISITHELKFIISQRLSHEISQEEFLLRQKSLLQEFYALAERSSVSRIQAETPRCNVASDIRTRLGELVAI